MSKTEPGRIVAEELQRVLGELGRVDNELARLADDRKRIGILANRLLQVLRIEVGGPVSNRLVEDLGLTEQIATLPGVPGRKPGDASRDSRPTPVARAAGRKPKQPKTVPSRMPARREPPESVAPPVLAKGTPLKMLAGVYQGWTGVVAWIRMNGTRATYTVTLTSPDGRTGRTQVTQRSLGTKWILVKGAGLTTATRKTRASKSTTAGKSSAPVAVPKGTPIRMLTGMYQGWTGFVRAGRVTGSTVTYEIALVGPSGKKGRTGAGHGTLGKTWEVLADSKVAEKAPEPGPTAVSVAASTPAAEPSQAKSKPDSADRPAPVLTRRQPPGIVPKGTPIRMLAGMYLGYTGVVATVQPKPGPRPDAFYTLSLTGPDGQNTRTSVKQSSLGRVWTREP
jgi:hypothetical protein